MTDRKPATVILTLVLSLAVISAPLGGTLAGPVSPVEVVEAATTTLVDGFEDGDTTEWSQSSHISAVQDHTFEGDYAGYVDAGGSNDYAGISISGADNVTWYYRKDPADSNNVFFVITDASDNDQIHCKYSIECWDGNAYSDIFQGPLEDGVWYQFHLSSLGGGGFNYRIKRMDTETVVAEGSDGADGSINNVESLRFRTSSTNNQGKPVYVDNIYMDTQPEDTLAPRYLSKPVSGRVVSGDGGVKDGVVVEAYGVKEPNINPGAGETKAERAAEIRERISSFDAEKIGWEPDKQLTGNNGYFATADGKYVAVHGTDEWALEKWTDTPQLGNPRLIAPGDKDFILSVWDPSAGGFIQDTTNSDLPGAVVDDTNITLTQLDYRGSAIKTYTVQTDETYQSDTFASDHDYARVNLPPGFYRVSAGGSPVSYVIAVGDPNAITNAMISDLQDREGALSRQAELLDSRVGNSTVVRLTTTTYTKNGERGHFNVSVPNGVKVVQVQAYSPSARSLDDPTNASFNDLLRLANSEGYNESFVVTRNPKKTRVPSENVTVRAVEVSSLPYQEPGVWDNRSEFLDYLLQNTSFAESVASYLNTSRLNKSEVQELHKQLETLARENAELQSRYEELIQQERGDETNVEVVLDQNGTREELLTEVRLLRQAIRDEQDPSLSEPPEEPGSFSNGTVSTTIPFNGDLSEDAASVTAHLTNSGTSVPVPEQYWTVEKRVGQDDAVKITDYPVPEGENVVTFGVTVASEDGGSIGNKRVRVVNSSFSGSLFQLESVSMSTLRPGASEQVTMNLNPEEGSPGVKSVNAEVSHRGSAVTATTSGDEVTFTTAGRGPHYVRLEITDTAGNTWHETVAVKAFQRNLEAPPSVMARDGSGGLYAVVGDGLTGGSVSTSGGAVTTTAVSPSGDIPASVHYHTATVTGQYTTTRVRLMKESGSTSATSVQKHVTVFVHTNRIDENAVIYRNGDEPLKARGENAYGTVTCPENSSGCVIESYTGSDGTATFTVNNNPGPVDSAIHWARMMIPVNPSWSPLTATADTPPAIHPPTPDGVASALAGLMGGAGGSSGVIA